MPNGFFLVLSGSIEDKIIYLRNEIPCLGGLPLIGAAFSDYKRETHKTNLRSLSILMRKCNTSRSMNRTSGKNKNRLKASWKYQTQEALDWMNLKSELYPNFDTGDCDCD